MNSHHISRSLARPPFFGSVDIRFWTSSRGYSPGILDGHLSSLAHSISISQSVLVTLIGAAALAVRTRYFRWTQRYVHCILERKTPYICPSPSMRVLFKVVEAALSNTLPE